MKIQQNGKLVFDLTKDFYATNADALAAGLEVGEVYVTNSEDGTSTGMLVTVQPDA